MFQTTKQSWKITDLKFHELISSDWITIETPIEITIEFTIEIFIEKMSNCKPYENHPTSIELLNFAAP